MTYESKKRGADNSLQFDRIMKYSKPSPLTTAHKLLNGTPYFKKEHFDEVSIIIGTRNNCPKAHVPALTVFYCINQRQTQKDPEKNMNYVNFKILVQVNRIRNACESEIYEAKNEDADSDFVYCTFPICKDSKLLGVDKHIYMISVLGDPSTCFFDNGFSDGDEKKPL